MSILEQDEIDALMQSAQDASDKSSKPPARPQVHHDHSNLSPELRKLLNLQVPIIVHLADRNMQMGDIIEWAAGSIIEFSRPSDSELDLVVGNRQVGKGHAVKVGENFGLRITDIGPLEERIRAMGS